MGVATRAIIRLRNGSGFWWKRVGPRIGNGMDGGEVPVDLATGITPAGVAPGQYVYDLARLGRCALELAKASVLV